MPAPAVLAPDGAPIRAGTASLYPGDALAHYAAWPAPVCIVADGPYGLGKFEGEPVSVDGLAEWYEPHVAAWAAKAAANTTLWFWCSELGWATVHPVLERHGWQYEELCVWDKGLAHIAGNVNSKTIRGVPVVTEVTVRYTRRVTLPSADGARLPLQAWLRAEWRRSGLPMYQANAACGVKNAATRKYLTECHLWYFPPGEAVVRMAAYCAARGRTTGRPYFSLDGQTPLAADVWDRLRAKWRHVHGVTNVWHEPPVHNGERIRGEGNGGYLHANQKPIALMARQVLACTDPGDVVWESFGGLCSASIAALRAGRPSYAAEHNPVYFAAGGNRLRLQAAVLAAPPAAPATGQLHLRLHRPAGRR